jgi:hypothetical protein
MILLQLLLCAAFVFIIVAVVGGACVGLGCMILPPIEKAIDDTAEKIAPTPDRYKKQQEVWDSYIYIKDHRKNLRGTTIEEMRQRENCTEKEAQMYMIFEDCQDMGIKMNIAYADRLTGVSEEQAQRAKFEKQFPTQQATYQTETLPGHTRLTREEVAAKYAAQK